MDRAKELRQMMKSSGKKDDGGGLSGKDKLKMMRNMKQQKAEAAAPPPTSRPSMSKPASAPIKTIDPKDTKFMEEWKKSSSILPAGFFDGGVTHKSSQPVKPAAPVVSQPKLAVPPTQAPKPEAPSSFKPQSSSSAVSTKTVANLPMEFFDNAREELVARGINLQQHILQQKKEADKEFQSFLEEIDDIKETVDEEVVADIQDEAAMKEFEEQAIQMAYMAKLAVLYNKSDAVVGATAPRVVTNVDDQQIENSLVEMDTVIANNSSSSGATAAATEVVDSSVTSGAVKVRQDVEDILYRKLQLEKLKKRKLQVFSQSVKESIQQGGSSSSNKRQAINNNSSSSSSKRTVEQEEEEEDEEEDSDGSDSDVDYNDLNYSLFKN